MNPPLNETVKMSDFHYCQNETSCMFMDDSDVRYPNIDTMELMITTWIHESWEERVCIDNCTIDGLFEINGNHVKNYYIPMIEAYSLHISHTMKAIDFCRGTLAEQTKCSFQATSQSMRGEMHFMNASHFEHVVYPPHTGTFVEVDLL